MENNHSVRMFKSLLQGYCPQFVTTYPYLQENNNNLDCIKVVCIPNLKNSFQGKNAFLIMCQDKKTKEISYLEASMNF